MTDNESTTSQPETLTPVEAERMWQHGSHLDSMLFQRGNLFLVAESLLIVGYTGVLPEPGTSGPPILAACVIAAFGMLLTCVWGYVGHRHLRYYTLLRARMRQHLPEYRALREQWRPRGPSSLPLVTYSLPLLAAVMWIILLLIALSW
jgi:hypothetical protein